jgi:hypothetical protein
VVEIDISESPRAVVDGLSLRTAEPCEKAMSSVASSRFAVITDHALSELFRVSALGAAIASEPDLSNSLLALSTPVYSFDAELTTLWNA